MFKCDKCDSIFNSKHELDIHNTLQHGLVPEYPCTKCGKIFMKQFIRKRHELNCGQFKCKYCEFEFHSLHNMRRHEQVCGNTMEDEDPAPKKHRVEPSKKQLLKLTHNNDGIAEYETAFDNRLKSFFLRCSECQDLKTFLNYAKDLIIELIKSQLEVHKTIKFNLMTECLFSNFHEEECDRAFKTENKSVTIETDLDNILENSFKKIISEMEESQMKNSGWSFIAVDGLRLRINKYNPLRGSTYIPLPQEIAAKKACINVKNNDSKCFMYSVLAKFIDKTPHRPNQYTKLLDKYDFSCISYPTPLDEIKKFEKRNNMSINVYGITKKSIYILKIADEEKDDHRDLLFLKSKNGNGHYVYIKEFEKLMNDQISKRDHKKLICRRCFTHFDDRYGKSREIKLQEHKLWCNNKKAVRVEMPTSKPFVEFEHVERCMRVPFTVYCDFESILKTVDGCRPNYSKSYTLKYQEHEPMSFCVYLKIADEFAGMFPSLPKEPYIYRGPDAPEKLLSYLKNIAESVSKIYNLKTPMIPLTEEELVTFKSSILCYMCEKPFEETDIKVRDHCHISGKFRGAAHNNCNLKYKNPYFLPVLFHNLSGYDSHFIIKKLDYDSKQIDVIPNTEEKYISFSKTINPNMKIRFLDTFRFMSASLDNLVKNLPILREMNKFYDESQIPLLKRKGVFPYDYVTNVNKLCETKLPKKDDFYNILNMTHISEDDYEHACNVWKTFEFKNLGEYSDHYLKTDVLLLADVFESFRDVTIRTHKLDPCHYFTLPGLTWDSMLNFTKIQLELLQDYDQILMVEAGIRGGICSVSHRYIEANNQHMDKYDPNKESVYINYQDCTNLYGCAMTKYLPYGGFEWISPDNFTFDNLTGEDDFGYILDVDIHYPEHLHKQHNDLPFLAEIIEVNAQKKLVPHLNDRSNYIVHYMALKQAIEHGLVLKKINRILKFKQSAWLKPYIDYNTKLRAAAQNDFEKDLYKMYNNAVFGKTMENIRNRLNMRIVCDARQLEKLIAKPEFVDRTIYSENLAAIHLKKKIIVFNKPIYVGMAILDLSKIVMYDYHYNVMQKKYDADKLKLAYMDTDSLLYQIKTENLYNDMTDMLEYLDTSDYPKDHPCYSIKNKKKPGTFKDEAQGKVIEKYIGLRPKMYSIQLKGKVIKKAKGVQNAVIKKCVDFEDYEQCLFSNISLRFPTNHIRSKIHVISSVEINKLALSPYDDKRIILDDGISTTAIGYKTI